MITRTAKRRTFTVTDNAIIEDNRLSFKALGLLIYLLSKPDNWTVSELQLAKVHHCGRVAVRSGLQELEQVGYLVRLRTHDEKGYIVNESYIFDEPQAIADYPMSDFPTSDNPTSDNRTLVSTVVVSPVVTSTVKAYISPPEKSETIQEQTNDPDFAIVAEKLCTVGVILASPYDADKYRDLIATFGYRAVCDGIDAARANDAQNSFGYVAACSKTAAQKIAKHQAKGSQNGKHPDARPADVEQFAPLPADFVDARELARLELARRAASVPH